MRARPPPGTRRRNSVVILPPPVAPGPPEGHVGDQTLEFVVKLRGPCGSLVFRGPQVSGPLMLGRIDGRKDRSRRPSPVFGYDSNMCSKARKMSICNDSFLLKSPL